MNNVDGSNCTYLKGRKNCCCLFLHSSFSSLSLLLSIPSSSSDEYLSIPYSLLVLSSLSLSGCLGTCLHYNAIVTRSLILNLDQGTAAMDKPKLPSIESMLQGATAAINTRGKAYNSTEK